MKKFFDLKNMPYYAALFQALQFAHAGSVYFGPFGWVIGGVGGGIVNLIIAASASRISDVAQKRKAISYVFGALLLLLSPVAIAPAAYITADAITWDWVRWTVAIVWAALPDLSIALAGAIVGKSLISHSDGQQAQNKPLSDSSEPQKPLKRRSAKKSEPLSDVHCRYHPMCERTFTSQNAANAHARMCQFKPTTVMVEAQKAEK